MSLLSDFQDDMKQAAKEHHEKEMEDIEVSECTECGNQEGLHECGGCNEMFSAKDPEFDLGSHLCLDCSRLLS